MQDASGGESRAGDSRAGHDGGSGETRRERRRRRLAARMEAKLHGYALLLVMIVTAFVLEGVAGSGDWALALLTVLLGATLMLSLQVAAAGQRVMTLAGVVVAGLILATVVQSITGGVDDTVARVANGLLVAIAPPAIIIGVIRRLRAAQAVTVDAVLGVISVYILTGMLYSFLYGAIDRIGTVPFFAQGQTATLSHCLYFSFTTLSTVGYGDFTAATNVGHTLAVSEALFGQVYLVTVVSLIVGNLGRRRGAESPITPLRRR
jgi:Ion channel